MADPFDALRQPDDAGGPEPRASPRSCAAASPTCSTPTPPGGSMTITEPAARTGLRLRPYLVGRTAPTPPSRSTPTSSAPASSATSSAATTAGSATASSTSTAAAFYLADAYPEYGIDAPDPAVGVALHLEVADADATVARADGARAPRCCSRWRIASTALAPAPSATRSATSGRSTRPARSAPAGRSRPGDGRRRLPLRDRRPRRAGPVRTAHPHGGGGRQRRRAGRRLLHGRRARPRPSGGVLRRAVRLGRPPERRGLPHRERLAARVASTARPPSRASRSSSGSTTSPPPPPRVRELGGTVLDEAVHPSGGNARCLDDQGVPFQLWQPAPGY